MPPAPKHIRRWFQFSYRRRLLRSPGWSVFFMLLVPLSALALALLLPYLQAVRILIRGE